MIRYDQGDQLLDPLPQRFSELHQPRRLIRLGVYLTGDACPQNLFSSFRNSTYFASSLLLAEAIKASSGWKRQGLLTSDVFVPLVFAAGEEAQVDWGEATVVVSGQERTLQFFCVRLAFSRATFVRAYERQD